MLNVLCHHNVIIYVLHSQNMCLYADLNIWMFTPLEFFDTLTPFFPSCNQIKCLLLHVIIDPIFGIFRSMTRTSCDYALTESNILHIFWCYHWHSCISNWGFRFIHATVKKHSQDLTCDLSSKQNSIKKQLWAGNTHSHIDFYDIFANYQCHKRHSSIKQNLARLK